MAGPGPIIAIEYKIKSHEKMILSQSDFRLCHTCTKKASFRPVKKQCVDIEQYF